MIYHHSASTSRWCVCSGTADKTSCLLCPSSQALADQDAHLAKCIHTDTACSAAACCTHTWVYVILTSRGQISAACIYTSVKCLLTVTGTNGCIQVIWREGFPPDCADSLLGTALVDLSLLPIMGHISGWYNITDSRWVPV